MYSNPEKTAVRKALADRTGLALQTVRYDEEALVGDHRGRNLRLYNFNKGRGGIYFCIDVELARPAEPSLLIRSGLTGVLTSQVKDQTDRPAGQRFVDNFLVEGEPTDAVLRVLDSASIQGGLMAAFEHCGGVEAKTEDDRLVFEQLDQGQHDADYLMDIIALLEELADAIEAEGSG